MKNIEIYTDGACSGNPGPGGWSAILRYTTTDGRIYEKEISGREDDHTTNNRMELMAVIEGLKRLNQPCNVTIYCDSTYVTNAYNQGWLAKWKKNNYKKKGLNIPNHDLWRVLDELTSKHNVNFVWVKGHNGNALNERCDELAVAAIAM